MAQYFLCSFGPKLIAPWKLIRQINDTPAAGPAQTRRAILIRTSTGETARPRTIPVKGLEFGGIDQITGLEGIPACQPPSPHIHHEQETAFKQLAAAVGRPKRLYEILYEDGDGVATEETVSAYSDRTPRFILCFSSIIGFLASLVTSVLASLYPEKSPLVESWITVLCWAFLLLQVTNLSLERRSVNRFRLGIYGAFSCLFLIGVICLETRLLKVTYGGGYTYYLSAFVQGATAVVALFAYVSLPRRPDVFNNDGLVDRQFTVSAISRYTFTWCEPLLKLAALKRRLEMDDLPALDELTTSNSLQRRFHAMKRKGKLWKLVFWCHAAAFIRQWLLTLLASVMGFAPQFCMYRILQLLEKRMLGDFFDTEAWWWVAGLGVGQITQAWLEAWLYWVCWCQLCVPIRSQLSALIFQKAMRKKDVKGVQEDSGKRETQENGEHSELTPEPNKKGKDSGPEDDEILKSRQGTINLIGIDTKRIANFTSFNNAFPETLFNLVISLAFLLNLIGWRPLLAGFAATVLLTPLNIYFAKEYSYAQDNLMRERDHKIEVVTEALQGLRQIKFQGNEIQWHEKIRKVRERELGQQWRVFTTDSVLIFCWIAGPVILAAVSLAVYSVIHSDLSPSIAFTALAVFSRLEFSLAIVPELTTNLLDALVSVNRIEKYLDSPEKGSDIASGDAITFHHASVAWPSDNPEDGDRYILRNINLSFPSGDVISGKTGSGKSLLLASILGESDVLSGAIQVPEAPSMNDRYYHNAARDNWIISSSIAFVAQIPWIENATIRSNITFGLPDDHTRYRSVIRACALEKDLETLTDGDMTEVGANGINLSGGQKWRVTFARALYSRAGVLILDDIFSAVDAHVGKHIFKEGLTGELGQGRTRILVTHHVAMCLPRTKYAVLLGGGTVEQAGLVADLRGSRVLTEILTHERSFAVDECEEGNESSPKVYAVANGNNSTGANEGGSGAEGATAPKKFVEEEKRESGRVKWKIYREYLKSSGGLWFWAMALAVFVGYEIVLVGRSWWVKIWTGGHKIEAAAAHYSTHYYSLQEVSRTAPSIKPPDDLWYYLGIYAGLSIAISIVGGFKYLWIFRGSLRASRELFEKLTFAVLRAPLRWIDTVPLGRVLNRFTSDFDTIDSKMGNDIASLMYNVLQVLGIVVAGLFVSPYMVPIAGILLGICLYYARRFLAGAREVKRLESNGISPVFELFGASLTGVGTIRAFGKADEYVDRMFSRIDDHIRAFWYMWVFNRWMGFRMAMVGAIFAILVAAIIVSIKGIDASLAGFAMGFALDFANRVIWMIRCYSNTELNMNSCERVVEYSKLNIEDQSGIEAPAAWPQEGRLTVEGLVVGYAPDLPPVLKGLSFSVEKNQRVGIVGRTGAGKSSLTLALFRFLEAREGTIYIDGLDISGIKLHDLRGRIAIIPQDPVLFSGTVRSNLDTFNDYTDAELHDALERVHLIPSASHTSNPKNFPSLTSPISPGGLNLSQGQRQLLCLARAIVRRPKIMVLDEATSAVDMETDTLIQRSIREEFMDSTLLVIAHRLSTVRDFDKILVLGEGRVVEEGSPEELVGKKGGFWEMIGKEEEEERRSGKA
ncbi:MAG: hypothetical protein M1840_005917 [Geoglossum simile]|nr:MAG: hypothetical protein M1840_005917 [Geoglossum simile]